MTVVVFDSGILLLALRPEARIPLDPATKKPVEKARARVDHLIDTLSQGKTPVLIPTPALAEVLVLAKDAGAAIVAELRTMPALRIADFDTKSAIECALLTGAAIKKHGKRGAATDQPYQKVKVDRQIVAIAKANGATTIYTMDEGLAALAIAEKIRAVSLAELPLPPIDAQHALPFEDDAIGPKAR